MMNQPKSRPSGDADRLTKKLQEQGFDDEDVATFLPLLERLGQWHAPSPTSEATDRLLARLEPLLPGPSPIRVALQTGPVGFTSMLQERFAQTCLQLTLFRPWFWFSSTLIAILGLILTAQSGVDRSLLLELLGPALSYLAVAAVTRAVPSNTLELEFACPVSAKQLTLTRLLIVLGYDVSLGLILSLVWRAAGVNVLPLTLHWLAPLLLVSGLSLLLSGRLGVHLAVGAVTIAWLLSTILVQSSVDLAHTAGLATGQRAVVLALCGIAAIVVAIVRSEARSRRQLHHG